MKKIIITYLTIFSFQISLGQTSFGETVVTCSKLSEIDSSINWVRKFYDLSIYRKNCVSLGDAGESSNGDQYRKQFEDVIDFFDSTFSDTSLVNIIKNNYCPLVNCYSFLALAEKRNNFITDSILVQLLIPMTKDSLSNVNLDWGCGQSSIQPFEYLMHVMVGNKRKTFLTNIIPLSHENIKLLINERKPYFPQTNQYKMGWTWEEYKTKFLKN